MQTEHQRAREQLVTALLEERTFIATPSDFWQSWQLLERLPLSPKRSRAGPLRCGSQSRRKERVPASVFYVDGHRKPVYADALIPRGSIGRNC